MISPLHLTPSVSREGLLNQIVHLDRQVFDLQSLLKAGEALFNELDVESLCRLIIAMVHERAGLEQIAVVLHDREAALMRVFDQRGLPESTRGLTFPVVDGILWRLLRAGEPFTVVDSRGEPRFPDIFHRYGLEALGGVLWVPLVVAGRVVGLISLGGERLKSCPLSEDFAFLGMLASLASGALSTSVLYQSVAVARKELDRSLHNLSMLFDITRALGAISDLTQLLRLILERAIMAVDAEKGSLMLMDEATEELMIRVVFGLPDKEVERKINDGEITCKRFKKGEGVAGKVFETGETIRVHNVNRDGDFVKNDSSHVQSILCVPLAVDDEVIGVINITNKRAGIAFNKEDVAILEALANQAAVAIARTRLYEAAISDSLTGLFIRRFVLHRLQEEARRTRRYDTPMSVIMCDIDHFTSVNDTYGHPAGDAVIIAVARAIQQSVREGVDIVGRYGGEEFVVVLPQTDLQGASRAAERIRCSIEALKIDIDDKTTLKVTLSSGCAQFNGSCDDDTPDACLKRADEALYDSKKAGRNRVTPTPAPPTLAHPAAAIADLVAAAEAPTTATAFPAPAAEASTADLATAGF